jgi:hypothetical protein
MSTHAWPTLHHVPATVNAVTGTRQGNRTAIRSDNEWVWQDTGRRVRSAQATYGPFAEVAA